MRNAKCGVKESVFLHQAQTKGRTTLKPGAKLKGNARDNDMRKQIANRKTGDKTSNQKLIHI